MEGSRIKAVVDVNLDAKCRFDHTAKAGNELFLSTLYAPTYTIREFVGDPDSVLIDLTAHPFFVKQPVGRKIIKDDISDFACE